VTDYTKPTGTAGIMTIRDNGTTVELWLYIPEASYINDLPWAFTVNGRTEWRVFERPDKDNDAPAIVNHQLHKMDVTYSQSVGFLLGDTNNAEIGGPTDFYVYLNRGAGGSGAHLTVGTSLRKAIPYVNVNGVWRVAEPWSKIAGEWKQTV
jgi:hypothetical protein